MSKAALKSAPPPGPASGSAATSRPGPGAASARDGEAGNTSDGVVAPPARRGRRKFVVLALLLAAIGGGTAAWFSASGEEAAPPPNQKAVEKPAVFINLETFTVNLQAEASEQYLQTSLTVKASDERLNEAMKMHMPEIRNALLLLLSSKLPSQILTVEGKLELADQILAAVRKPLPDALREHVVAVYYTSFVIQ
jgi:flagellar FliL protein